MICCYIKYLSKIEIINYHNNKQDNNDFYGILNKVKSKCFHLLLQRSVDFWGAKIK